MLPTSPRGHPLHLGSLWHSVALAVPDGVTAIFAGGSSGPSAERRWAVEGLRVCERDRVPSGKLTFFYGKSPFSMGKSTINDNFQ